MQLSGPVQLIVVFGALVPNSVPQVWMPLQSSEQLLVAPWQSGALHDCRPGQRMSQVAA